jgi:transportin-3
VLTQLTLALADLALQMPEWTNVVQGMIEQFGKNPVTVPVLLRFLGALAEESLNPRLPASVSSKRDESGDRNWFADIVQARPQRI